MSGPSILSNLHMSAFGLGFGVWGLGIRVWGLGLGLGFGV